MIEMIQRGQLELQKSKALRFELLALYKAIGQRGAISYFGMGVCEPTTLPLQINLMIIKLLENRNLMI